MNVEFNENNSLNYSNYAPKSSSGGLTKMIIKWGLAKDEKGANIVMIIITVVCFGLMIYIGF